MSNAYSDPQAFRQAVTDRLRRIARANPAIQLQDLQRQFAYDRLLSRIFSSDPERWILKGATAMLARLAGVARHTVDIDLYRRAHDLDEAEAALRACAAVDLDDWFRFALSPGHIIEPQGVRALRIPVVAYIGATAFTNFHADLVTDIAMTGTPEIVAALVQIDVPGITRISYRAYPVVDHIADKLCAILETHLRENGVVEPSSRYRDLADILIFAHTTEVDAAALTKAIRSEGIRRHIELPDRLVVPESADWPAGYARVARDAPGLPERDLNSAVAAGARFLDPILSGQAKGHWDPLALVWITTQSTLR